MLVTMQLDAQENTNEVFWRQKWLSAGYLRALRKYPGGATGTNVRGTIWTHIWAACRPGLLLSIDGILLLCDNVKNVMDKTAPRILARRVWLLHSRYYAGTADMRRPLDRR